MLATLSIIILALAWLARETRCLRVRLLAGPPLLVPEYAEIRAAWDTFDWSDWGTRRSGFSNGHYHWKWATKDWKVPICGWEWIKGRNHIIPEYRIEFNVWGCRYTWKLGASSAAAKILGEAMKVNAKPHKPPKLPSSGIRRSKPIRRRRVAVAAG